MNHLQQRVIIKQRTVPEHDMIPLAWLVKFVIWPWSLSTCRLKSSFSSFIRSLSLLSFLKSSSKIFTWKYKRRRASGQMRIVLKTEMNPGHLPHFNSNKKSPTCSFSTAIWVSSSCFLRLLAASAKLLWPGGCCEDDGVWRFKASSKAWRKKIKTETSLHKQRNISTVEV